MEALLSFAAIVIAANFMVFAVKPGMHAIADFAEYIACNADWVRTSASIKSRNLGNFAIVVTIDGRKELSRHNKNHSAEESSPCILQLL